MHTTLYTQLANTYSTLNTFNDVVLDAAIMQFTQLAANKQAFASVLVDALNEAYDDDMQYVQHDAQRANVALARTMLHDAAMQMQLSNYDTAANLLAQAILQRYYAMQQLLA